MADLLAEALEPWAQRLRDAADDRDAWPGQSEPSTCTWCPVCAVVGLLRGERPELASRLAEHGVGLLTALRELLAAHAAREGGAEPTDSPGGSGGGGRRAQHVPVRRTGATGPPTGPPAGGGGAGC